MNANLMHFLLASILIEEEKKIAAILVCLVGARKKTAKKFANVSTYTLV